MRVEGLDSEIEKLRAKRVELASKVNITRDNEEKEELRSHIERLQRQIETLERMSAKSK